jgi:hypothetical protein
MKIPPMSEHNIQASFVDSVLWQYKSDPTFLRPLFFAVPNGAYLGGRSPVTFAKLKREGFLQGVADILYLQPRGVWSFMAIELKTEKRKREKDRGLSVDQVSFLDAVSEAGGLPSVCYGVDEAIEAFTLYMSRPPREIFDRSDMLQSRDPA